MQRTQRRFGCHEDTPFPSILDEFLVNSREKQALYANLQTSCNTVINPCGDSRRVREFVYDTVFFDVSKRLDTETDNRKLRLVDALQTTILRIGTGSYHGDREFEMSAVWVLYFDHAKKTEEAVPVFKVYAGRPGVPTAFLGVDSRVFHSWDEYIGEAQFPESLLCAPRNGEYRFKDGGDDLYLDYMCASDPRQLYAESYSTFRSLYTAPRIPLLEKLSSLPGKIITEAMEALAELKRCYDKYMGPVIEKILSIQKKAVEAVKRELDEVDFWSGFVSLLFKRVRRLPAEVAKDTKECSRVGDNFWSEDVVPLHGRSVSSRREWLVNLQESLHEKSEALKESVCAVLRQLQIKAGEFLKAAKVFWDLNKGVLIRFFVNLAVTFWSGTSSSPVHLLEFGRVLKEIKWEVGETESTEMGPVPHSGSVGGRMAPKDLVSGQKTQLVNELSVEVQGLLNSSDLEKLAKLLSEERKNWKQILLQGCVILLRYGVRALALFLRATEIVVAPVAVCFTCLLEEISQHLATSIDKRAIMDLEALPLGNASGNDTQNMIDTK